MRDWRAIPKLDLHVHLNGCIRPSTTERLQREYNIELPEGFDIARDLQITAPVGNLPEYFKPWTLLKRFPIGRSCLEAMVLDCVESLASDGVVYAELRNSPFNIAELNAISLREALRWLTEAIQESNDKLAVRTPLILSISRYTPDPSKVDELLKAISEIDLKELVVGLDLSGDENTPIYPAVTHAFRKAKYELGLGISIHAGETGIGDNILWAVEQCGAQRIAHALGAAKRPDILEVLNKRDICIEVCLKSNILTGGISDIDAHPVTAFIDHGVPFVLCSDNPQVHNYSLSEEYALFESTFGRTDLIETMNERARRYAFSKQ